MVVSASQVRDHIIRHLEWDDSLKGSKISVDYVRRTAILTGTVPNLEAREAAVRDAQSISGVDRVEDRLTVEYNHKHPNKSDKEVQADVSKILSCTALINPQKVQTAVQDGIVTLTGSIDAYWKLARIEDLVSSVEGVLEVKDKLEAEPEDTPPDKSIRDDILLALERMEVKGLEHLELKVKNGKVTIGGTVPTWDTALDVEYTARYTSGVRDLKNELTVE